MQVRDKYLKGEIALTKETYTMEKYDEKTFLSVSLETGWQKKISGRSYDYPSDVLHCIGGHTKDYIFLHLKEFM